MVNYREILRLSSDPKSTQRSIAVAVHSSRDTIREVQKAAKKVGVQWPLDDNVTNEMLRSILFPEKFAATSLYVQPDYPRIHADLALPGVNMTLLWMEYSKRCEAEGTTPYMYTQFCEKYRQWARITSIWHTTPMISPNGLPPSGQARPPSFGTFSPVGKSRSKASKPAPA